MRRPHKSIFKFTGPIAILFTICSITLFALFFSSSALADPVNFYQSFAGNYNYVVTGGTLRTSASNQCAVTTSGTAPLSGVPTNPTTTIRAAYLYWAGSGSTPDLTVTFESTSVSADRSFTESVGGSWPRDWFGGFEDVTNIVRNKAGGPNGNYSFADLSVDSGGDHCTIATVLSGWGLVVIYEDTASEPLRVLNLFDGLQNFWGSSITLTPSNFQVPNSGIDGKFGVLTWEGDQGNSNSYNGFDEELRFNGTTLIQNPINPAGNQYNSTISVLGATNVYGVDFDEYDVSSTLSAGDTSASTFYSTGQDRVLLMLEIISVTNTPVADLSIAKSHSGSFIAGQQGVYTISATNNGPNDDPGPVTVTDTLPAGLTYVSGSGTNWSCNPGSPVTCTYTGTTTGGTSLPDITLTVAVDAAAPSSVTNSASVSGTLFDNNAANNNANDPTDVFNPGPSSGTKQLYFYMAESPAPDTNTIQRVINPNNTRSNTMSAGDSTAYILSPATQAPLTLQAGNIPASLWLRRRGGGGTRDVSVTLDYFGGSSGTLGSQTLNNILGNNAWQLISFNINIASAITLNANTTLRLTLTHDTSSSGSIRARSLNGGIRSQIALGTTTVINVDNVDAYSNVPFPGGAVQSSYAHNTNTRIRAVVSDPFGHNDITSALITIIDPSSTSVVTDAPMTEVDPLLTTPPVATKTYEYPFAIPVGPNGTWTVLVTANEGSEGTISDQGMGTFVVGMPNIVISKSVATISNPVEGATNAHAIPGAIMQYDIVVTNTGIGPADQDSIEITDALPDDLRLVLNSPIAPALFIDGDTYGQNPSGLIFSPADVGNNPSPYNNVALSNDGGTTFLLPGSISQTPAGIDSTEPKIDYIRINPKGVFAGATGGPPPSFTIRLQLQLE